VCVRVCVCVCVYVSYVRIIKGIKLWETIQLKSFRPYCQLRCWEDIWEVERSSGKMCLGGCQIVFLWCGVAVKKV